MIPGEIWMVDDETETRTLVKKLLSSYLEKYNNSHIADGKLENTIKLEQFDNPDDFKLHVLQNVKNPPDVILLDICLNEGENRIILEGFENVDNFADLYDISGIRLLTWLRYIWPNVSIVIMSNYWEEGFNLPRLSPHVVSLIHKRNWLNPALIPLIYISQQTIFGVKINETFLERNEKSIRDILNLANNCQDHFKFVICNDEKELIKPHIILDDFYQDSINVVNKNSLRARLFETWNNRIVGIIEDNYFEKTISSVMDFNYLLPFGSRRLIRSPANITDNIEYMGSNYLNIMILRELIKHTYMSEFDLQHHPLDTGNCLFDSSDYPPDLISGIERLSLCDDCKKSIYRHNNNGGWSSLRQKSADKLFKTCYSLIRDI